jgi:hypothetical protein
MKKEESYTANVMENWPVQDHDECERPRHRNQGVIVVESNDTGTPAPYPRRVAGVCASAIDHCWRDRSGLSSPSLCGARSAGRCGFEHIQSLVLDGRPAAALEAKLVHASGQWSGARHGGSSDSVPVLRGSVRHHHDVSYDKNISALFCAHFLTDHLPGGCCDLLFHLGDVRAIRWGPSG